MQRIDNNEKKIIKSAEHIYLHLYLGLRLFKGTENKAKNSTSLVSSKKSETSANVGNCVGKKEAERLIESSRNEAKKRQLNSYENPYVYLPEK